MSFLIGVLDEELVDECLVVKDGFSAGYQAHKVYLGRNVTLPTDVNISMTMLFKTMDKLKSFFAFWEEKTLNGAKPFYVKLPLFGDMKHYLVLLNGEITQSFSPSIKISGKFVLYRNRTLDENIPPSIDDMTINVEMDSTNNYVFVPVSDAGDEISYTVSTNVLHGVLNSVGGGTFYYTPNDGFSGTDTFSVIVTDALGISSAARITVNVVNWKSSVAFKWGLTYDLQSFIEYSNDTLLTQEVKDALATLANAKIIYNTDALPQIDYSACTGIASISFDSDGNMIVETVRVVDVPSDLPFKWGLTDDLQSFIEYSNDTLLDQTVKDDLATLANAKIIYNTDALPQIDYSACTGIASISFDSDGNMIVETVN